MATATALTPHLIARDGNAAVDYYTKAFGAAEIVRMPAPDGKRLMHVELRIGGMKFYVCDDFPEYHGGKSRLLPPGTLSPITLHLEVPDCDAAMAQAAAAGGTITMPAADMFWGDRYGKLVDPSGFEWSFSTPLKKA